MTRSDHSDRAENHNQIDQKAAIAVHVRGAIGLDEVDRHWETNGAVIDFGALASRHPTARPDLWRRLPNRRLVYPAHRR